MSPTVIVLLVLCAFAGVGLIVLLFLEERAHRKLTNLNRKLHNAEFELSTLKKVSNDYGYNLSIEKVAENIALAIQRFLPYSTLSYILNEEGGLVIRTYINEGIQKSYLEDTDKILLDAVAAIDDRLRETDVQKIVQGGVVSGDNRAATHPLSYFNIPLVVKGELMGLLSVTSSKKKAYQEEDMKIFYSLINQSLKDIEMLNAVIETEQGKLNAMLISIPSGAIVFLVQKNGLKLTSINASAKQFLHITGEGDTKKVLASFSTNLHLEESLNKVLSDKKDTTIEHVTLFDKVFRIFITPVFLYGTGKVLGVTLTMQDITLEKQIQEIRDTFTNMVVHELRAPLTSMKGASELILSGHLEEKDQQKMLRLIKESTVSMLDEIGQLLDAAKIEAGKFMLRKELASINDVVKQRADVFTPTAQQKEIGITVEQERIPQFEFDRERVSQILNNLLSNSMKFTHQRGIIHIKVSLEGDFVRLMVSDNGIGIPAEKQSTLFNKYIQANQGQVKTSGGTGLGLYISKNIIESHGGKIWFESQEGSGTTFYFTLPLVNVVSANTTSPKPILEASMMIH